MVLPGALEQIVDNLVDNALAVAPHGSTISIRLSGDEGRARVVVVDQGPGMPPDQRVRALDRFWRGPDQGSDGSGLGLAIVDRLARASGGRVFLQDAPSGGLAVSVDLPLAPT
jgi:signal transduction histidine kinase